MPLPAHLLYWSVSLDLILLGFSFGSPLRPNEKFLSFCQFARHGERIDKQIMFVALSPQS